MKRIVIISLFSLFMASALYPWSSTAHQSMTKLAAQKILGLTDTSKIKKLDVKVEYQLSMDFLGTILKGTNFTGTHGVGDAFIGYMIDQTALDKLNVDTTMTYKDKTLLEIFTQGGSDPDEFDKYTGLYGEGNVTIQHILTPEGVGFADVMVELFYNKAKTAWNKKKYNQAYAYLAYASHYLEDAGIPLHTGITFTEIQCVQWQYEFHTESEHWVDDKWAKNTLYNSTADSAAGAPMPICDLRAAVRALSMETFPDITEWSDAWGFTSGDTYNKNPLANGKRFDDVVIRCIWRTVPRVAGLFLKFKTDVIDGK